MGIETLNEDLELNIPMFDDDMDIIAKLDDEPNAVGGLSAAELKAEFDRPGKTIQEYLNKTLIPSLIGTVAEESVRAQNEYVRVTNENQRIANEEAREKAEQAREDKTSGIVAQATEQAKKAEEQAKLAGQVKSMQAEAETLPAGSEATAKTEEENGRLVLKLGLPRGETGPRGKEGPPGPRGEPGNVDFEALTPEQMEMLKGDPGEPGPPGASPNISILPGERDEEDGTVRYGTVIEVTNPDGSKVYSFVPDGRDGGPGPAGPAGKDGGQGKDGVTFTPSVSSAGVLSWTNDGGKQNPTSVNIKGPAGPAGKDGGQGKDGERGLAIYRANKPWSDWSSEYFDFSDFQLPNGYVPRVNDLVLTSNNYLCWIYEVNAVTDTFLVASFSPPANLNGGTGSAGSAGKDGVTFTPSVSSAGVLSWTNDGGKQNPSSVNIKGPAGPAGKDGGQGKDGERGLAIYRCSQAMYGMTSDTIDFAKFQLPVGYVPKVNDLVITADNYLYYVYEVNVATDAITLASFYPPVNLNGAEGPAGPAGKPGDTPYIGANGNWWIGGTDTGVAATGSGSGGASVQADWGENDETKLSHVKGRTHWKEAAAPTVFVEEENAVFAGKSRTFIFQDFSPYRKDIIGKTFEATWKGEVYSMQGEAYATYAVVGNKGLAFASEEDTGEPCCFVFEFNSTTPDKSDVVVVYRTPGQGERISYKLARIEPDIYHKLDPGYLPEGVPYTEESLVELLNVTAEVDPDSGAAILNETGVDVAPGDSVVVNYNGTDYDCTAVDAADFAPEGAIIEPGTWAMGNIDAMLGAGDSGHPFVLQGAKGQFTALIPLDGSTTVSVTISKTSKVIHKVPLKYLPEGVGYTEEGLIEVLPEVGIDIDPDEGIGVLPVDPPELAVGKTYTVTWNGTAYECVGQEFNSPADDGSMTYIGVCVGDLGGMMGGDSTGEPFLFAVVDPSMVEAMGMPSVIIAFDGSMSTTMSISAQGEIVHPVPGKFLPDYLPSIENIGGIILPETTATEADSEGAYFDVTGDTVKWESGVYYDITLNGKTYRCVVSPNAVGSENLWIREYVADKTGNLALCPFIAQFWELNNTAFFVFGGLNVGDTVKIEGPIIYNKMSRLFMPTSSEPLSIYLGYAPSGDIHSINVTETELEQAISDHRQIILYFSYNGSSALRAYTFAEYSPKVRFTSVVITSDSVAWCYGIEIESFNGDGTVTVTEYRKSI